jgi:hypothetical protein
VRTTNLGRILRGIRAEIEASKRETFPCRIRLRSATIPDRARDPPAVYTRPILVNVEYPVIVKPNAEGTSKGITKNSVVDDEAGVRAAARELIDRYDQPALVEEYITGREFTVGVYLDCPFFIPASSGVGRSDGSGGDRRGDVPLDGIGDRSDGAGVQAAQVDAFLIVLSEAAFRPIHLRKPGERRLIQIPRLMFVTTGISRRQLQSRDANRNAVLHPSKS